MKYLKAGLASSRKRWRRAPPTSSDSTRTARTAVAWTSAGRPTTDSAEDAIVTMMADTAETVILAVAVISVVMAAVGVMVGTTAVALVETVAAAVLDAAVVEYAAFETGVRLVALVAEVAGIVVSTGIANLLPI